MGNSTSVYLQSIFANASRRKEKKVMIHGLDSAGKTTMLYQLKQWRQEVTTFIPTLGFVMETLKWNGHELVAWDVGGRSKMRSLWVHFFEHVDALIFMIDSRDREFLDDAVYQMHSILTHKSLHGLPLLILCNKQDLPNVMTVDEVCERLEIDESGFLSGHPFLVHGCSALCNHGVQEGMDKLLRLMDESPSRQADLMAQLARERKLKDAPIIETCGYLPHKENAVLQQFEEIKRNSQCPFARAARLWGSKTYEEDSCDQGQKDKPTVQQIAEDTAPALAEFARHSNNGEALDGFCVNLTECKNMSSDGTPDAIGRCVFDFLTALAHHDPTGDNVSMKFPKCIGHPGWRFRFSQADFFSTTFAPCYPETSSRFAFSSDHVFLLFQPEESFARHSLPPDTPDTNWEHPKTIRDRTRATFAYNGRRYHIPDTTKYSAALDVVKPLHDDGTSIVRWWEQDEEVGEEDATCTDETTTVASEMTHTDDFTQTSADDESHS